MHKIQPQKLLKSLDNVNIKYKYLRKKYLPYILEYLKMSMKLNLNILT